MTLNKGDLCSKCWKDRTTTFWDKYHLPQAHTHTHTHKHTHTHTHTHTHSTWIWGYVDTNRICLEIELVMLSEVSYFHMNCQLGSYKTSWLGHGLLCALFLKFCRCCFVSKVTQLLFLPEGNSWRWLDRSADICTNYWLMCLPYGKNKVFSILNGSPPFELFSRLILTHMKIACM